jgi:hypothetical protein
MECSGKCHVPTFRARILKRICDLEEDIAELRNCFNAVSPAHRLPVELLMTVFSFVSRFATGSEMLGVSHVCKRWRTIALDCPHLWAELRGSCLATKEVTQSMLEKSREVPLTLSCGTRPTEHPSHSGALSIALSQISRLKSVTLCNTIYADGDTVDLPNVLSGWRRAHAPILEILCIINIVDDDYYSSGFGPPSWEKLQEFQLEGLLESGAPALRHLTLSHLGISWSNLPLGASLVELRLLEEPSFEGNFRPVIPTFIKSLEQMPLLETLELHGFLPAEQGSAHSGRVHAFPPALKTLKVADSSGVLAQFFQLARVADHVSIFVTFLQEEIDDEAVGLVLGCIKSSFSQKRATTGVQRLTERDMSTCFDLYFNDTELPANIRALGGCMGQLSIECGTEPTPHMEAHDYYAAITNHFDLSTLRSLKYSWSELDCHQDIAWSYLRNIRRLETITFSQSQFSPFLNHWKLDPLLSSTGDVQSVKMCYFPAVATINCVSSRFLGYDGPIHQGCLTSLVRVLKARLRLGCPLLTLSLDENQVGEEGARYLQESVPGLVVHRLAPGPTSPFE